MWFILFKLYICILDLIRKCAYLQFVHTNRLGHNVIFRKVTFFSGNWFDFVVYLSFFVCLFFCLFFCFFGYNYSLVLMLLNCGVGEDS